MELVYIFCNPLLQNIIQDKCLTLYEYASVKVKKNKKKNDPSLDILCQDGASHSQSILDPVRTCQSGRIGAGAPHNAIPTYFSIYKNQSLSR